MSAADDAAQAAAKLRAGLSDTSEGLCVSVDWTNRLVTVNVGGGSQKMPWLGAPPFIGDRVRVIYAGRKPICELIQGSPVGTVVGVASNLATCTGDDGKTYTYAIENGATLSAGQRVRLDHAGRLVILRYAVDPPGLVPAGSNASPGGAGSATFLPIDSGCFRSGVFDSQYVEASSSRVAAYWYGTQMADTIPDAAVITRAEIHLVELWDQIPGAPTPMGTHTQPTRGAVPTVTGTINVFGSGTVALGGFADLLKTGAAYGIGFLGTTGWRRFDKYSGSGGIYMEWR